MFGADRELEVCAPTFDKIAPPQVNHGVKSKPQSLEWEIIADDFFTIKLEFFARIVRDC